MFTRIPESDWKVLSRLKPVLLERFCKTVLEQVSRMVEGPRETYHKRYLEVYRFLHDKDKELGMAFDDLRRSNARERFLAMCSLGLVSEEEFVLFSEETRKFVKMIQSL